MTERGRFCLSMAILEPFAFVGWWKLHQIRSPAGTVADLGFNDVYLVAALTVTTFIIVYLWSFSDPDLRSQKIVEPLAPEQIPKTPPVG